MAEKFETNDFIIVVYDDAVSIRGKGGQLHGYLGFPRSLMGAFVAAVRRAAGDKKEHS